uniref:Uncharacterized protein n=1 Tax=Arundo donax TaxID=35708 RepID=A0A0A9BLL3_ARUDO
MTSVFETRSYNLFRSTEGINLPAP